MKFIGQYIQSFIARFRNDVYLEDISTGTIASGGNLGLDSNNKIVKATEASGDITGVRITTDSGGGGVASVASGSADFSLLGTSGVGVTNSGTTITATSVPGEIDHDSLLNFVAAEHYRWDNDISSTATINASNIPTLNQSTTGNAATATNLTASTSTAVGLGTIELGHADDTTIARSASGTVTIESKEVMTKDKKLHVVHAAFQDNIGTSEHFIPFNSTAESAAITNLNVPILMPTAGKLLKLHMKVTAHHNTSSNEITFKLYDIDSDELWSSGNSNVLGTKVIDGTLRTSIMEADFTDLTTAGASGTNAFAANDLIGVTIQNSQNINTNTNYLIVMVFELDFNSY